MKSLLFNPFEKYSEKWLIGAGLVFMLLGSLLASYTMSNFDGALDLHFSHYQLTFIEILLQNTVNVLVLALALFVFGKILNSKTRLIDLIAVVFIARIPLYFMSLFNLTHVLSIGQSNDLQEVMAFAQSNMVFLIFMTVIMLIAIIWMFVILFNGYKTATNGKGAKSIVFFILAIILAEIISKIIINTLIL